MCVWGYTFLVNYVVKKNISIYNVLIYISRRHECMQNTTHVHTQKVELELDTITKIYYLHLHHKIYTYVHTSYTRVWHAFIDYRNTIKNQK